MQIRWVFLGLLVLAGCSAESGDPVAGDPIQASGEPPFYNVYRNGLGPLTMDELQIDLPAELEALYTDEMEACLLTQIEILAAEAGDPETLNPADVAFLPTDGSWEELTRFGRRNILAQAVVSRAATLC